MGWEPRRRELAADDSVHAGIAEESTAGAVGRGLSFVIFSRESIASVGARLRAGGRARTRDAPHVEKIWEKLDQSVPYLVFVRKRRPELLR